MSTPTLSLPHRGGGESLEFFMVCRLEGRSRDDKKSSGFSHGGRWRHCWDAYRGGSGEKILCQCRLVATLNSLTYNALWVMKRKALPRSLWPAPSAMSTWMPGRSRLRKSSKRPFTFRSSTSPNCWDWPLV